MLSGGLEGTSCNAGDYRAAPGDCEGYLQCEGGQWRKQRCAPGLHWAAAVQRCDWPSFAKCTGKYSYITSTVNLITQLQNILRMYCQGYVQSLKTLIQ